MQIKHHENGDSEFIIPTIMKVGASDKGSSSVVIGNEKLLIRRTIYQEDVNSFRVYDEIKHISDPMKSKEECINWIIKQLKGELK